VSTAAAAVPARALTDKVIANGNEILRAAAIAFLERGYAATSIDDIAARLGCTKGRVYHYFRTKGEIYLGIHRQMMQKALESIADITESDDPPAERIRKMARTHAMLMMEEPGFRLAGMDADMSLATEGRTKVEEVHAILELRKQYQQAFQAVIQQGIRSGEFRKAPAGLSALAVLGALNWMSVWFDDSREDDPASRKQIAREFATFVTCGLRK
jgi:AcrR family transcriptional regulator